ncbi:MAG: hypothetical protein ABSH22_00915 [Tepidisphaeraceae bacterium]
MQSWIRSTLCFAAMAAGLAAPSLVKADTITATLTSLDPYVFGTLDLQGSPSVDGGIGNIIWQGASTNEAPFAAGFNTYCIDLIQDVDFGGTYTFNIEPLASAPKAGAYIGGTPSNGMGTAKADDLEALFGVDYSKTQGSSPSAETAKEAFQLAIWNIIYDSDSSVSTGSGTFYAGSDVASGAISVANGFLADALNPNNQQYDATDLIALVGENGAQDQIALDPLIPISAQPPSGAPLPSSGLAGLVLIAGFGFFKWHRRAGAA